MPGVKMDYKPTVPALGQIIVPRFELADVGHDFRITGTLRRAVGCFGMQSAVSAARPDVVHLIHQSTQPLLYIAANENDAAYKVRMYEP